jgi:hypothetical protein
MDKTRRFRRTERMTRARRDHPDCSVADARRIVEDLGLVERGAYGEALDSVRPLAEAIRAERALSSLGIE